MLGPAIRSLAKGGVSLSGPIPADTVFTRALRGEFDAVVAPYHDVGMAGFKTASFGSGVNVTLGLPFVRTSPDHGTAFDIAGTGKADPSSMTEALRLAARLVREVGNSSTKQIDRAYRLARCRAPTAAERAALSTFLIQESASLAEESRKNGLQIRPDVAKRKALQQLCRVIFNLNEFVYPD